MTNHQPFNNATYASIADFNSAVQLPCRHADNKTIWEGFVTHGRMSNWYGAGCHTGMDVLALMRDGWHDGRDRMMELRSKLTNIDLAPRDRRRRMVRGPQGDVLDIHAVYAGRLDVAWRAPRRVNMQGPQRVDLVANMICSGFEHADVLFYRGAAAAVLADMLETAGYMCRLSVAFGGKADGVKTSCRITVKEHGMPFDVTSTSAVILPGFFRALGHAWIANHCPHKRDTGGISVGQGIVEPHELLLSHNVRDHGTAVAFIEETLAKVNDGTLLAAA